MSRWDWDPEPVGTPLTPPRACPSCKLEHPVGTTCRGPVAELVAKGATDEQIAEAQGLLEALRARPS